MKLLFGTPLKRFLKQYRRTARPERQMACLLQSVEYPVNVGSVFRLADGIDMAEVVLSGITPKPNHPTIVKVGRNKHQRVQWKHFRESEEAIAHVKRAGYTLVAVELTDSAVPYHEFEYPNKVCLVVGNEDHGVPNAILAHCDASVFIPMYGKGLSLNVHTALGIVAYHALHAPST